MEWSHDFCLSCDRQISQSDHGAYCSQSCRLADLERASTSSGSPASYTSMSSQASNPGSSFYLPPALNFSTISSRQPSSGAPSPTSRSPTSLHAPTAYSMGSHSYGERSTQQLYSSPSRSSLSSLNSSGQQESTILSDKVRNELREYAGSFDHVRDWKRRMTVV